MLFADGLTLAVGWETMSGAAAVIAGGIIGGAKLLIAYQVEKDKQHAADIQKVVDSHKETADGFREEVRSARAEHKELFSTVVKVQEKTVAAVGKLETAVQGLTQRVDLLDRHRDDS